MEAINKMKRSPEQEKIFVNNMFDKELISKIYTQLTQLKKYSN